MQNIFRNKISNEAIRRQHQLRILHWACSGRIQVIAVAVCLRLTDAGNAARGQ